MMKSLPINSLKNWLIILSAWSLCAGCATNLMSHQERFQGQGFRALTPSLQSRAVVWGNHSEAVSEATDWLNNEQILVLYRLADDDIDATTMASQAKAKPQAHMLSAARRVGAPLLVFLEVNEKLAEHNNDPMGLDDEAPRTVEVEIRGMNADTHDLVFGATVWNPEPLVVSDQLIIDLTTFALRKALKEPEASFPPQQMVQNQEKLRGQGQGHSAQRATEIFAKLPTSQPKEVVTNSSTSTNANLSKTKGQPDLPLQENLPQQKKPNTKITALSAPHSDEIPPTSLASLRRKNQPTILAQQPAESRHFGDKKKAEVDITPIEPPTDDAAREAELQPSLSSGFDERPQTEDSSVGIRVASGALSLLYTPIKVTYAVLGGFFGGFAYLLTGGNEEAAFSVWDSSLGGTYWITPEHLRGNESIYFKGPSNSVKGAQ